LAAIDDGWWALGRHYRVRAEPREWIDCADGRLLVLGHYTGQARVTKLPVEAGYAHLFTERDARLAELVQFTDTAVWRAAAGLQ
jgi:2-(1,2-epoxy-1,2-dihydrophenyl)acetyl-CoA isomerase